jgi:HK97 family phage portal protein
MVVAMPRATPSRRKSPLSPTTKKPAARRSPRGEARSTTLVGTLRDEFPWGQFSRDRVPPEVAVRVSSVFSVCRFLAQSVGCMSPRLKVRVGGKTLDAAQGYGDPASSVYRQATTALRVRPNPWQSPFDFYTLQTFWTALHGRGFARIIPGVRGAMTHLIPLHPRRMVIKQLDDYSLAYEWLDPKRGWVQLPQSEVLHFRWLGDCGITGTPPTETLSTAITLARELDTAAMGLWRNGARPDFVIETSKSMGDEAYKRLRQEFQEMYGGNNRGAPAVLEPHMKLLPMQSNTMEQSQFQQLRESTLPEVASHWGVPASLVGDVKAQRYANPESDNLSAQIWCLLPWQKRMEGAVNLWLQDTYGEDTFFQLDNRALLRGDSVARANLYRALFSMSAITPNEIRDLEDFPLREEPEADMTFMQLGFSTLANAAKGVAGGGAGAGAKDSTANDHGTTDPSTIDPSADPLAAAATGLDMSSTALNGAQVTALVAVLQQVSAGLLTEASAVALIQAAFPTVSYEAAKQIVSGAMPAPASQGA